MINGQTDKLVVLFDKYIERYDKGGFTKQITEVSMPTEQNNKDEKDYYEGTIKWAKTKRPLVYIFIGLFIIGLII